jgi:nucleoid DNA-binding protein
LKVSQVLTKKIVQMTFDLIVDTLVQNGRIELRKFGVFEVKTRKPRKARNPVTNDPVQVPAKNVVTFHPGKDMEEKVRFALKVVEPKKKKKTGGKGTKPPADAQMPEPKAVAPETPPAEPQVAPVSVPSEPEA